jgi:hypothetical protein
MKPKLFNLVNIENFGFFFCKKNLYELSEIKIKNMNYFYIKKLEITKQH